MGALCAPCGCDQLRVESWKPRPGNNVDLRPQKKSPPTRQWIRDVILESNVFMHVADTHLDIVIDDFDGPTFVGPGTVVIQQGDTVAGNDPGLYLLESGSLDVFVKKASQEPPGTLVYTFDKPGQTFGHLALLYNCPRCASVVAATQTVLWHINRDRFKSSMDGDHLKRIVARHCQTIAMTGFKEHSLSSEFAIFNIALVDGSEIKENLIRYYSICRDSKDLSLTTSCFTPWHKNKKANGFAKVIPAIHSSSADPVRVFFFDDNIEWDGRERSSGIVNLRDVRNGDFVEFGEGMNGFKCELVAGNSLVGHSPQYRNVLVQVNILDAMEDENFFTNIVQKYSKPNEKIIVFMDCNATIISMDSISGKDMAEVLLGTMFQMLKIVPSEPFDYVWDQLPAVKIEKAMDLKQLVKKLAGQDNEFYTHFFKWDNCVKMLNSIVNLTTLQWTNRTDNTFYIDDFKEMYDRYLVSLVGGTDEEGITHSWYKIYANLTAGGHSVILNSFGVDTRKVIVRTVPDERRVLQFVVNVELWSPKDVKSFEEIYDMTLPVSKR